MYAVSVGGGCALKKRAHIATKTRGGANEYGEDEGVSDYTNPDISRSHTSLLLVRSKPGDEDRT